MKKNAMCTILFCVVCSSGVARAADTNTSIASYLTGHGARCDSRPGADCRPVGYEVFDAEDDFERYANGFERWWRGIHESFRRRKLRGYKRVQADHHEFLYPQCPPHCSPTYGHHQTMWRPFPPDCEYTWTTYPGQAISPIPAAAPGLLMPLAPTPQYQSAPPPQLAPGAETPYFPESTPAIQPFDQSPPAPPAEPAPLPGTGAFQTSRSRVEPAAYDLPVIMHIE